MEANEVRVLIIALVLSVVSGCSVHISEDVPIEMRDGINLMADVYLPPGRGPFPVILTRIPYGTKSEYVFQPAVGNFFAENGFAIKTERGPGTDRSTHFPALQPGARIGNASRSHHVRSSLVFTGILRENASCHRGGRNSHGEASRKARTLLHKKGSANSCSDRSEG